MGESSGSGMQLWPRGTKSSSDVILKLARSPVWENVLTFFHSTEESKSLLLRGWRARLGAIKGVTFSGDLLLGSLGTVETPPKRFRVGGGQSEGFTP